MGRHDEWWMRGPQRPSSNSCSLLAVTHNRRRLKYGDTVLSSYGLQFHGNVMALYSIIAD